MAQMTPVATETPATETTPEALPTLPALPVLSTPTPATSFNGGLAPLSTFNGGLAPLSTQSSPNFTLPTTTANNDQMLGQFLDFSLINLRPFLKAFPLKFLFSFPEGQVQG